MIYQLRLYTSLQKHLQLLPLNCPSNKNFLSKATLPKKKNNANETIKKIHTHIPIPFSPAIKGDSGPPIMGPPYGKLPIPFPYVKRDSGLGRFVWVPRCPMSHWGSLKVQIFHDDPIAKLCRNPRCEVLAAAEVYKIMAAAEALATDLDMRIDDGCKVSGLQSEITQAIGR